MEADALIQLNGDLVNLATSYGVVLDEGVLDRLTYHVAAVFDLFDPTLV